MNTHNPHFSIWHKIATRIYSIFHTSIMHVKISKEGMRVLQDRQLTRKVVDSIIEHKKELDEGKSVQIDHHGNDIILKQSASIDIPTDTKINK